MFYSEVLHPFKVVGISGFSSPQFSSLFYSVKGTFHDSCILPMLENCARSRRGGEQLSAGIEQSEAEALVWPFFRGFWLQANSL